jgi:hypothetical protein
MRSARVAAITTGVKALFISRGMPTAASKTSFATSGAERVREDPTRSASSHHGSGRHLAERGTSLEWVDVGLMF